MKRISIFVLPFVTMLSLAGCASNKTNVGEGAAIGGLLGATAGGIIGHQSGHGLEGAGIGAAAGVLTGAIVGSQMPKQGQGSASEGAVSSTSSPVNQLTIQNIIDMHKQNVNDAVIIDRIRMSG
ncbi:MAG: glycine zipper domain-containing protein, partial [Candidatus Omnitrophica bacterium]|nr:glycine zipper domain-containing protein [Candidatus Omnitrophota bacterium]